MMKKRYENPLILKVLPARIPKSADDWDDPATIGVSLVVAYYPRPYINQRAELICVDARKGGDLKKILKPNIDVIIGYGLRCWDLKSLYVCRDFTIQGDINIVDLAEIVREGLLLSVGYSEHTWGKPIEEVGHRKKLVDIMTATLNNDYKEACDYLQLTRMWLQGEKNYVVNHIARMVKGIYRVFVFADTYKYLLLPSPVKGRVDKLVITMED